LAYGGNGVRHTNKLKLRLVLGLVTTFDRSDIPVFSRPLRHTQPGHPSVGRCNECWWWFRLPVVRKWRSA